MGYQTLTDTCAMPFGKYKGTPMADVKVSYLHWLWENGLKQKTKENSVAKYIEDNLDGLKLEDEDLIWS